MLVPRLLKSALALAKASGVIGGQVFPVAVDYGCFCRYLEGLQGLSYKGLVNYEYVFFIPE